MDVPIRDVIVSCTTSAGPAKKYIFRIILLLIHLLIHVTHLIELLINRFYYDGILPSQK